MLSWSGPNVFLRRMPSRVYEFQNLRYFTIEFFTYNTPLQRNIDEIIADVGNVGIVLGCDGQIKFTVDIGSVEEMSDTDRIRVRSFEATLRQRFRFGCSKSKRGVIIS